MRTRMRDFFDELAFDISILLKAKGLGIRYVNPYVSLKSYFSPGHLNALEGPRGICLLEGRGSYVSVDIRREDLDGNLLRDVIRGEFREESSRKIVVGYVGGEEERSIEVSIGIPYMVREINLLWWYGMVRDFGGKYRTWGITSVFTNWVIDLYDTGGDAYIYILGPLDRYSETIRKLMRILTRFLVIMQGKTPVI